MPDQADQGPLFFFGAMSPYSWFAAERIERLLPDARWHGVLAGVIFKAHDRVSWGLTDRRAAGIADCEARADEHGLGPMRWPDPWPTSDLAAARGMVYAQTRGLLKEFSLCAMRMAFLEGRDLEQRDTVLEAGRRVGFAPHEFAVALQDQAVKDGLRALNDQALALGVFGVPTVVLGTELFWGDDRLDSAAHAYSALRGA
jgi:2-hydroxychromene-2-carboxylate isomerase